MILKIVLPKNNRRKNGVLDSKHCWIQQKEDHNIGF
jgi:hypothetical protein